jgi:poly(3-hydroxyalkanoate) synthetase
MTYLFLGAFILHSASRIVVHFNFWINQEFIAENLCENREKPQLECNGMCHLKKELDKDDERKQQQDKQQVEIVLFMQTEKDYKIQKTEAFLIEKQCHYTFVLQQNTVEYHSSIFHPPIA